MAYSNLSFVRMNQKYIKYIKQNFVISILHRLKKKKTLPNIMLDD